MVNRSDVVAMLDELVALTTLEEGSPQSFKVRAYDKARQALESHPDDITNLSVAELTAIADVGQATANKVVELVRTGRVAKLDELRAKYPPEFAALAHIGGIGPKTLKLMRSQLGIENLDGLKAALDAQQIRDLPRMGPASEAKIARAIDRMGMTGKHRKAPAAQAWPVAQRLAEHLESLEEVDEVKICGSLRRMAETVSDVDITVASHSPEVAVAAVLAHPLVDQVLGAGTTKVSIVTGQGLQIDVRVVAPHQFGAATLYFTGSRAHNVALRQRALEQGLLLNEYGLIDQESGEVLASADEASIYRGLGLDHIAPPLREGTGEIEAAATGDLPDLVKLADIRGDLHFHSDRSGDGRSPLTQMVDQAAKRGYQYLAITDHGEDLTINGANRSEMLAHRRSIRALQAQYRDMTLLYGCELNIGRDGGLDYDDEFRSGFDYTVASVHSHFDLPKAQQTARLVRAISDPSVTSIGHLTGRHIGRRPGIELDVDLVLEALFQFDVALEINGSPNRLDAGAEVVRRAVRRGVKLVINTDSHHISELGRMRYGVLTAQRGWAPRDLVVNTWDRDRFLAWVRSTKPTVGVSPSGREP